MPNTFLTPPWGEMGCTGCITKASGTTQPLSGDMSSNGSHDFVDSDRAWFKFTSPLSTWKVSRQRFEQVYWWQVDIGSVSSAATTSQYNYLYPYLVLTDFDPTTLTHATAPTDTQCVRLSSTYTAVRPGNDQVFTPNRNGAGRRFTIWPIWNPATLSDFTFSGDVNSLQGVFGGTYDDDLFVGGHAITDGFTAEPERVSEASGEITSYTDATKEYTFSPALDSYTAGFFNVFPIVYGVAFFMDSDPTGITTLSNFTNPALRWLNNL